jgi:hypothetical protein
VYQYVIEPEETLSKSPEIDFASAGRARGWNCDPIPQPGDIRARDYNNDVLGT